MSEPRQPPAPDAEADARTDGPWTKDEAGRGAGMPANDAGVAGAGSTKARPNDDRARTEGAAADIQRATAQDHASVDQPPPDPNTVIVGGIGATQEEPDPADPQAPRNPL